MAWLFTYDAYSKYKNTIIYRIVCKDVNITDMYIGHTTCFPNRKNEHKYNCTNTNAEKYNCRVYQFIRKNGEWKNWEMIEIERYPCNDRIEATKQERYWLEHYKATLNCEVPGRTRAERVETKKLERLQRKNEIKVELLDNGCWVELVHNVV